MGETTPSDPNHRTPAGRELVEHVTVGGDVIEIVTRSEMRARRLRHRCTYIAVVTSDRRLVVHRRADWKDVYPGWWDLCFGGVCAVGEGWADAAHRELAEEAGLAGDLIDLGPVAYDGGPDATTGAVIGRVYLLQSDDAVTCPDGEVAETDTVAVADLDAWLSEREVCPDSRQCVAPLLARYLGPR